MTFDDFLLQGKIRCKMPDYRRKREKAIETAMAALENSRKAYVSISGGKDSVVCACIVDEAARRIGYSGLSLWVHVSDASFPGTEETCAALATQLDRPLTVDRSAGSAYDALHKKERRAFGKTGVFFDAIRAWNQASGCDLGFTGVRAYESMRRMSAAKAHGSIFETSVAGKIMMCNPITWFRLEDVAAALVEYDAPIHPIYRKTPIRTDRNKFGEDGFIRLGYITSRDLLNTGTAVFIRLNYPEQWQKLCSVWPEIKTYV